MSHAIATRVYDLYGRFYDAFDLFFKRRLARAISALPFIPGDRVLDVGIGTGLSLEYYPPCVHLTGLDLSPGMLHQAQRKLDQGLVRAHCPADHTRLIQGDALNLPFPDKSFDMVFLSHMISTVPDPHRCLAEARRVARDHAFLVIVNHFRSEYPVMSWLESAVDPICRKLGWRSDLALGELLSGAGVENLELLRRSDAGGGLLFRTVYLQKYKQTLRLTPMPLPVTRQARLNPI